MTATVVLVDDADEIREMLGAALRLAGGFEIVGEGASGRDAVDLAARLHPDLMVLDVSMPEMDGIDALPQVVAASPRTRVVVFSAMTGDHLDQRALEMGAARFLEKSTPLSEVAAILATVAGGPHLGSDGAGSGPLPQPRRSQGPAAVASAEDQQHPGADKFGLLVSAVRDYAIFMLDPDGRITTWNAGAQRIKGYRADEILGRHFEVFYPPDKRAQGHPGRELTWALRDGSYEEEGWRIRKDGSRFWANVVITAVHDAEGRHIGFAKVTRDMTERRDMVRQLEEANEQLRRAADEQAQMLAVTAHELRTPITVLAGSSDTLSHHWDRLGEEERRTLLKGIGTSSLRLQRLLNDLLTAAQLGAGTLDLKTSTVDLADLAATAVSEARSARPGLDIDFEGAGPAPVWADAGRLAQAIDNLIGNAARHGRPPVRVNVRRTPGRVEVRVTDAGAGVPVDQQPRLFTRFAAGGPTGGSGLGLFIVRQLAQAHGGDALYESRPGDGPSFVIRLPSATPDVADALT